MTSSFGARMRSHRERCGIGLDVIAQSTKIGVPILDAIERGDVTRLPSGIFRRAFIRAYATAVGLDPESTLDEFLANAPVASESGPDGALRLTLDDEPWRPSVRALRAPWSRIAAAACDLVAALALAAVLFAIAGRFWTCFGVATIGYYVGGMLLVGTSPAASVIGRRRRTHVGEPGPATIEQPHEQTEQNCERNVTFSLRTYRVGRI